MYDSSRTPMSCIHSMGDDGHGQRYKNRVIAYIPKCIYQILWAKGTCDNVFPCCMQIMRHPLARLVEVRYRIHYNI